MPPGWMGTTDCLTEYVLRLAFPYSIPSRDRTKGWLASPVPFPYFSAQGAKLEAPRRRNYIEPMAG